MVSWGTRNASTPRNGDTKANVHSDRTKAILIGSAMRDKDVVFVRETVCLTRHPICCADGDKHVWVLGRYMWIHDTCGWVLQACVGGSLCIQVCVCVCVCVCMYVCPFA